MATVGQQVGQLRSWLGVEEKRWGSEIVGVESCGASALRVAQVLIHSPGPPHLVPPASPQTREGLV